ncbi:MAG: histidinol dehydrogenase [Actinomycetota bacterium]|nr:histidinol dehydrogenase [Actinomycetota bacterium]
MPLLRVLDLRDRDRNPADVLPRPRIDVGAARADVTQILDAVRERGDAALRAFTSRFDGIELDGLAVPPDVLDSALVALEGQLRAALERAAAQVRWFHERARPSDWTAEHAGARLGQRFRPLGRVGVYVPGGLAAYPSTVIMTAVPARVAGVGEVVLCTPPTGGGGWPNRTILAAAALLDVDLVLRIGGAQAIAAMAYGTESVPACDKIVGPGNIYVTLAKQLVQSQGHCGIDAAAGPTEVAIIADRTADPRMVAADLVAQAEHDELATCLLVTPEEALVDRVQDALDTEVAGTRHRERVAAALEGQGAVILVDDLDHALDVVDAFAPEHLEVQTADAASLAERVRCAGAVFVGASTPVSLGDYAAGPNHTLPTSGTARFRGGLSTSDFLVPVNWVEYGEDALAELAPTVRGLAAAEDLPAHARAVDIRLGRPRPGGGRQEGPSVAGGRAEGPAGGGWQDRDGGGWDLL